MITVTQARMLLQNHYKRGVPKIVSLKEAYNQVLAENVHAVMNVPPFDNSAMDGYAFAFDAWNNNSLQVVGESAAGRPFAGNCKPGEAVRIYTGAHVPLGTDTVVMQEKVRLENDTLFILDSEIAKGQNVRPIGSQTKSGNLALASGNLLSPGTIGFLAGLGIAELKVFGTPKVGILVTGDEIVPPGQTLVHGEVFECNSHSLAAALALKDIFPTIEHCSDSAVEISNKIAEMLPSCDLLLVTGGVSVGDYDFVVPALEKNGVTRIFHGVKQKPAKPLYAGEKDGKMIFGLPGNPASVLTSYYVYVMPWIMHYIGRGSLQHYRAYIATDYTKKQGLTHFVKGTLKNDTVKITHGQESYRMDGFAVANCIIEISENTEKIKAKEIVNIIPFYQ